MVHPSKTPAYRSLSKITWFAVLLFISAGFCRAQDLKMPGSEGAPPPGAPATPVEAEGSEPPPETPLRKEFEAIEEELRAHLKAMRKTMVQFHLSDSNALDKKLREDWLEESKKGREIMSRLREKAIAAVRDNVEYNRDLVDFLFNILGQSAEDDNYDGCWPIVQLLIDLKFQDAQKKIDQLIGTTAFALNEYDVAKEYLVKAEQAGALDEEFGYRCLQSLDYFASRWPEEKTKREAEAKADDLPRVLLKTNRGDVVFELFENEAPETTANFIHLVEKGFYDGLTFHRAINHLVVQGGCPEGDGSSDAGYTIKSESQKPGARAHFRGAIGMALAGNDANSGGSQFYVCLTSLPGLDGRFTIFGRVIEGMDIISEMTRIGDKGGKEEKSKKEGTPDEIIEAKVLRKRNHEYTPTYARPPQE